MSGKRAVGRITSAEGAPVVRDESKPEPRSRSVESKVGKPRPSGGNRPGRPAIGEPAQIRLPADLLADVDRLARAEGVTRSQWIRQALAARVAAAKG